MALPGTRQLGDRMKDMITGFEGVATGYVRYLTGCHQFLLAPRVKDDGALVDSQWFDESRLKVTRGNAVTIPGGVPGVDEDDVDPDDAIDALKQRPRGADKPPPRHQ